MRHLCGRIRCRASIPKQKVISQIVELPNRNYPRRHLPRSHSLSLARGAINSKSSTASVNSVSNGSQRSAEPVKELLNRQYGLSRDRLPIVRYTCEQF